MTRYKESFDSQIKIMSEMKGYNHFHEIYKLPLLTHFTPQESQFSSVICLSQNTPSLCE